MSSGSLGEGSWRLDTFVVPEGSLGGSHVVLEGPEHRHAFSSVRARKGDDVRLIDGTGAEALARVESVERERATLEVLETRTHDRGDGVSLTIVQAIPKGRGMSDVVRCCAELGVESIVPVVTDRCVTRPSAASIPGRVERWNAVALAAAKQSRGVFVTRVEQPTALNALEGLLTGADRSIVAWEEESGRDLMSALTRPPRPSSLVAVVGPEGGLSEDEVSRLQVLGVEPVGFGRRVLRSDWAAAALAFVASQTLGGLLP